MQDGWCEVLDVSAHCCETNMEMKNYICGGFDKSSAMNTIERRIGFDRTTGMFRRCAIFCSQALVRKGNIAGHQIFLSVGQFSFKREQIVNRKKSFPW